MLATWLGNLLIRSFGVIALTPDAYHAGVTTSAHEWMLWLWYGARYDVLLSSWGVLAWLLPLAIGRAIFASTSAMRATFVAGVVLWFVTVNAAGLAEHFYRRYFGVPFGPQIFSIYDDDVRIAMNAAYHLLPVGTALLCALGLALIQTWCTLRLTLVPQRRATWRDAIVQIAVITTLWVAACGEPAARLTAQEGVSVARRPLLDDLLVNTPVRLYLAFRQSREALGQADSPNRALKSHGFDNVAALARALGVEGPGDEGDASKDSDETHEYDPTAALQHAAWHRTPRNAMLAAHPPHVVFGLMEGWGGYGLSLDADGFPIAGAMRRHLDAGWWFRHAVAARSDTISTLEHLLINSGSPSLMLTDSAAPVPFTSAAARPFRQNGYRTVFVYGGARTWRNVDRVMRRQGFDDVITQADIVARYPQADAGTYGVYDGYLWRYVHDMLEDADARGQPLFVFALTMSNHWPFNVPDDAATGPFDLTKGWRASPANAAERDERQRGVRAYRYAMDALGDFIDRLKYSPMSSRTILVATGDHRAPQWRNLDNASLSPFERYHVPIYFRVPRAYQPMGPLRLDDFVGHRDIFPTLYHLALSDTSYVGFGEPLFGVVPAARRYAVAQQRYLFSTAGAQDLRSGVSYTHVEGGDADMLGQQAADANASLALSEWFGEMQRLTRPASAASNE
ncbi:Lipoteichoic acid synthase 1 [Pandoraea anapnoica]|uniref:Lipoteichoic acid synthase 1 n=2 Tax=Pandoraea anapnoica TaxID=2508301 RepID=A0A5E5AED6_9BURK|nr:Lipoteichoic acid synthase 1 [Pandoraea anapnoica]